MLRLLRNRFPVTPARAALQQGHYQERHPEPYRGGRSAHKPAHHAGHRPGRRQRLRIYAIADVHSPDHFRMPRLRPKNYDLVITLGDISPATLEYVSFMAGNIPCIGVLGNHDPARVRGFNDLHGKTVTIKGVRIGGVGGAPGYRRAPNHYSEQQVGRLLKKMPQVDIFISHSPPLITSRDEDRLHRGFAAFDDYLRARPPQYWLHGHLQCRAHTRVNATAIYSISEQQGLELAFDRAGV